MYYLKETPAKYGLKPILVPRVWMKIYLTECDLFRMRSSTSLCDFLSSEFLCVSIFTFQSGT